MADESRLRRMIRSTPVRQAVALIAVVALVNLSSLGLVWLKLRADTISQLQADLARDVASFDITAPPAVLATLVEARARVTDPADTVYVFLGADGSVAGNAQAVVNGTEVGFTALDEGRMLSDEGYLNDLRRLSGGYLIVAESLEPVARLADVFLLLLVLSTLPTILIALAIGALIARASARRVERIEAVLARIAAGDLGARLAESGGGDDLSRIGVRVNRMAEKQETATEALRQVTTDIAHDLRTPLQRIGVMLADLNERLPDGEARDLTGEAMAEAERAVGVFRGLLQIAQIEGGSVQARFGEIALEPVVRRIVELYEPAAEDRGGALHLEIAPGEWRVRGDGDLIGQALANLIENALRHCPAGCEIRVGIAAVPGGVRLSIADGGPGIPVGERHKVLRRLYRMERSRTTPGNGLGLALVAAVAETHGARLWLGDNDPGLIVTLDFDL